MAIGSGKAFKFGSQDAVASDGTSTYLKSASNIYFQPSNSTKMTLVGSSGNLGIGTTSPGAKLTVDAGANGQGAPVEAIRIAGPNTPGSENGAQDLRWAFSGAGSSKIRGWRGSSWDTYLSFHTNLSTTGSDSPVERMRINHDGKVGIGTAPSYLLDVYNSINSNAPLLALRNPNAGASAAARLYMESNGNNFNIYTYGDGTSSANITEFYSSAGSSKFVFSPNGSERARLDDNGNFFVASTSNPYSYTNTILAKTIASEGSTRSYVIRQVSNENWNVANATMWIGRDGTNNRSINAGGTLNASGNDYAEYMTKAGDFTIAKGDICGIDSNGKLTNVWADAISFVVKSTDPSYVGGDSWGAGLDEAEMEVARPTVDRIAFSGQVPVNVYGAAPGDYIVPSQDGTGISGIAVSNPTFEQYMQAVGKVIAIESDGRAKIIVKNI